MDRVVQTVMFFLNVNVYRIVKDHMKTHRPVDVSDRMSSDLI